MEGDHRCLHRRPALCPDFYPRPPGGGRQTPTTRSSNLRNFYPRPPGGGRQKIDEKPIEDVEFLSTPSGWRATPIELSGRVCWINISIHALRVEGDILSLKITDEQIEFLSTPSGWRATILSWIQTLSFSFLSTPSGWRATAADDGTVTVTQFLSTPSGWRATLSQLYSDRDFQISIHALRVEGDICL